MTTRTRDSAQGSLQPHWRVARLKFLAVAIDNRPKRSPEAEDNTTRIPFRFDLKECQRFSTLQTDLPPSVDSSEESSGRTNLRKYDADYEYSIDYSIVASAFSGRKVIASMTQKISLIPVCQPQPPISVSDFPGEYFTAATTKPRSALGLRRRSDVRINVAAQEPRPLVLDTEAAQPPPTEVTLLVKLSPEASRSLPDLPTQCHVKARMLTRTLVTPSGSSQSMPTVEQALKSESSHVKVLRSHEQEYTLAIRHWDRYAPDSDDGFAIAHLSFLFSMPEYQKLGPTFFTPILSRRHSVDLSLSFPENVSQTLKLSLPLQVLYQTSEPAVPDDSMERMARKISNSVRVSEILPAYTRTVVV